MEEKRKADKYRLKLMISKGSAPLIPDGAKVISYILRYEGLSEYDYIMHGVVVLNEYKLWEWMASFEETFWNCPKETLNSNNIIKILNHYKSYDDAYDTCEPCAYFKYACKCDSRSVDERNEDLFIALNDMAIAMILSE